MDKLVSLPTMNLKLEHHPLLLNSGYGVRRKCKDVVCFQRTKVLLAHPKEFFRVVRLIWFGLAYVLISVSLCVRRCVRAERGKFSN